MWSIFTYCDGMVAIYIKVYKTLYFSIYSACRRVEGQTVLAMPNKLTIQNCVLFMSMK